MFELDQTFSPNILRHEKFLIVQPPHPTRCWTKMIDRLAGALDLPTGRGQNVLFFSRSARNQAKDF